MGRSPGRQPASGGRGPRGRTQATERRDADQDAFLAAFGLNGNITAAARAVDHDRDVHYRWLAEDDEDGTYARRFQAAREEFADRLEAEARRRAIDGVEEYVVSAGKLVVDDEGKPLVQRRYSDQLLVRLLEAKRPDEYRPRQQVEHSGPGGGPIRSEVKGDVSPEFVADVLRRLGEADGGPPAEGAG